MPRPRSHARSKADWRSDGFPTARDPLFPPRCTCVARGGCSACLRGASRHAAHARDLQSFAARTRRFARSLVSERGPSGSAPSPRSACPAPPDRTPRPGRNRRCRRHCRHPAAGFDGRGHGGDVGACGSAGCRFDLARTAGGRRHGGRGVRADGRADPRRDTRCSRTRRRRPVQPACGDDRARRGRCIRRHRSRRRRSHLPQSNR